MGRWPWADLGDKPCWGRGMAPTASGENRRGWGSDPGAQGGGAGGRGAPPGLCQASPRGLGARSPPARCLHREDAVAPGCKARGRGSRVTHLLGYPPQTARRSPRRQCAPPPCGGPEDVALAPRNAACEAGPAPVYVKVTCAESEDCARGPRPGQAGLVV